MINFSQQTVAQTLQNIKLSATFDKNRCVTVANDGIIGNIWTKPLRNRCEALKDRQRL